MYAILDSISNKFLILALWRCGRSAPAWLEVFLYDSYIDSTTPNNDYLPQLIEPIPSNQCCLIAPTPLISHLYLDQICWSLQDLSSQLLTIIEMHCVLICDRSVVDYTERRSDSEIQV